MEQVLSYLQNPWVIMAINGLIAGYLAGLLLGGGGLIRNLIVGVIGATPRRQPWSRWDFSNSSTWTGVTRRRLDSVVIIGTRYCISTIGADQIIVIIARIIAR